MHFWAENLVILKSILIDDNLETSTVVTGRPLPWWWGMEGGEADFQT